MNQNNIVNEEKIELDCDKKNQEKKFIIMDDDEDYEEDDIQVVRQLDSFHSSVQKNQQSQQFKYKKHAIRKQKTSNIQKVKRTTGENQIRELYRKGKFSEIYQLTLNDQSTYQEFRNLKYQGELYEVGQNVFIKNASNSNDDFIGKIVKIMAIKERETEKFICLCEVKWFYKRNEILGVKPCHSNWIAANEIFFTHQLDIILATAINGICQILTMQEYEKLEQVDRGVYFSRLTWLPEKKKFLEWDQLELHCLCKQPLNPDLPYIQCDRCDEWYHMGCVGVQNNKWEEKEYVCGRCR